MCLLRKIPQILHPEVLILNAYLIASYGGKDHPWLRLETSSWPKAESSCDEASDEHLKDHRSVHPILILLHYFSETKTAEETIIRWVQDEHGLVRVGGRLQNSQLPFNSKHPIILPSQHSISELLIKEQHIAHLHAGPTLLAHVLRQSHWIVGSRKLINKCIRKCLKCNKFKTSTTTPQLMGNLTKHRATLERPFFSCGIDYAGPVLIKCNKGRGTKSTKGLHCFILLVVVLPPHYSDNGTNFVGARRKLDEIRKLWLSLPTNEAISYYLSKSSIDWHFIPPSSPHFGVPEELPSTSNHRSWELLQNIKRGFGRSGVPNLSPPYNLKKWQDAQPNLKEDDIVLIKEEGPPGTWPMARVLHCIQATTDWFVLNCENPRLSV
ncbi:integrase catalytic domain-containing protein [Trichonephila clavipes]|nr:integrase catalytic domain-containing protein [Trichonephila clavipes]